MSKKLLEEIGMFDEFLKTVEDDDLIFRFIRKHPFYCLPEVVFFRRKHNTSITTGSALEPRIKNKYNVTKKNMALIDDSEITKSKTDILGYWTEEFARRHLYCKNYAYALKWIMIGLFFYPRYYLMRTRKKAQKLRP